MIITNALMNAISSGFKMDFSKAFEQTESHLEKIATITPSTGRDEKYIHFGSSPFLRQWAGDRVIQNLGKHEYTIQNLTFEATVELPREDVEDENLVPHKAVIQQLGMLAKSHPDELVFGLLRDGFEKPCYDGESFFSDVHPNGEKNGTTLYASNMSVPATDPGPAWFLLDATKFVKPLIFQKRRDYALVEKNNPDADTVFMRNVFTYGVDARVNAGYGLWQLAHASREELSYENFGKAVAAMRSLRAENGRPLDVKPSLLIVPPELELAALDVVMAQTMANGQSNPFHGRVELIVTPWIT